MKAAAIWPLNVFSCWTWEVWRKLSELHAKAPSRTNVSPALIRVLHNKGPPPQPVVKKLPGVSLWFPSTLRLGFSISAGCARRTSPSRLSLLSTTPPHRVASLSGLDMTFRRLKKVNSSGPGSGPASHDGDIYFPSSKSDSCRTAGFPSNSSEVYNYRTLAFSGGTLPRNFKKVKVQGLKVWIRFLASEVFISYSAGFICSSKQMCLLCFYPPLPTYLPFRLQITSLRKKSTFCFNFILLKLWLDKAWNVWQLIWK